MKSICYSARMIGVGLMAALLVTAEPVHATPPAPLRIVIVQGEGATNNIRQRTAREPIVEVVDENNRPVAGATVLFLLPDKGPSGVFADGSNQLKAITDQKGRATARGLTPNNAAGAFRIQIQASYLDHAATAVIHQSNVAATAALSGKLISLLAIGGGVAAGAAVAITRGGHADPVTQAPVISGTTVTAARPSIGGSRP